MKFLAVRNWDRFQHYSGRRPPWIKLYIALLDDVEFLTLSDRAKWQLLAIWLLAARLGHPLPNDAALIAGKIGTRKLAIDELLSHGWLIETNAEDASNLASNDASKMLGTRARARAVATEDRGQRTETTATTTTAAVVEKSSLDDRFTDPDAAAAYQGFRRAHRDPTAFDRCLVAAAAPITGNGFGWAVVGTALAQMAGNGTEFNLSLLRGYCRRVVTPPPTARPTSTRRERAHAAIAQFVAGDEPMGTGTDG